MVSVAEYEEACRHPIVLSERDIRYAFWHADSMMLDSGRMGMINLFGGSVADHHLGKIVEMAFGVSQNSWIANMGLQGLVSHTPFRSDYCRLDVRDDFEINGKKIEVKSGKTRYPTTVSIEKFGLQVPIEQVSSITADIIVYGLTNMNIWRGADGGACMSVIFAGWCTKDEVVDREVVKTVHDCHRVPIAELHPMGKLVEVLNTSISNAGVCIC